jgi:excisionase family DNA binding protein
MNIKILNLIEAANYLNMSAEALRRKAAESKIPGAKPGRRWCFREDDLAEHLRWLYAPSVKMSRHEQQRKEKWHSTKGTMCNGLISPTIVNEYKKQLGLKN